MKKSYADPYLAGAALGLVLLAAFVLTGRGLGASGAFATTAAGLTGAVSPAQRRTARSLRATSTRTARGATGCSSR